MNEPHDEGQAKVSPNGRWLVYVSNESGRSEIYSRAYPSGGHKVRLSQDGGHSPRWRSDGTEIFYVDLTGMLTALKVDAVDGEAPRFGQRQPLFPVSTTYTNVENYVLAPLYTTMSLKTDSASSRCGGRPTCSFPRCGLSPTGKACLVSDNAWRS